MNIVKVKYQGENGKLSEREYTYFSEEALLNGDVVKVPVRDTTTKAIVTNASVPPSEIEAYKDKARTIPRGSVIFGETHKQADEPIEQVIEEQCEEDVIQQIHEESALENSIIKSAVETALIRIAPEKDPAVVALMEEANKLLGYAERRTIASQDDMKHSTEDLSLIRNLKKALNNKLKEYLEPIKAGEGAIKSVIKPIADIVAKADTLTTSKMQAYTNELNRQAREQEEINRLRIEAAKKEAALNGTGEITEDVTLTAPVYVPKLTKTEVGTFGGRDNWKYEVIDFAALPDAYKVEDKALLNDTAKKYHDTRKVPGVIFYNDPTSQFRSK